MIYRGMDRAALDAAYNNTAAVGQAKRDAYVAGWTKRSEAIRTTPGARLDLRYGEGARHRLDVFPCGAPAAPTLVYIHGGYWQMNDKEPYAFLGEGLLRAGFHLALMEYTLAPAARLDQIVNQFLKAVRPTHPNLQPRSIHEILLEVLKVLQPEIANRDVLVEKELQRDLPNVLADSDQMKQVFFNIIRNSLQAMTRGGILHLRTELLADRVAIAIRDTGGGIPSDVLQHIFEPYFTTKNEGSGLGLMIVQRVVREHGGLVEVSSEQGRGTTFRILLPVAEKSVRLLGTEAEPVASKRVA